MRNRPLGGYCLRAQHCVAVVAVVNIYCVAVVAAVNIYCVAVVAVVNSLYVQLTGSNHRCLAQFKCVQTVVGQRFAGNGPNGLSYYYYYYCVAVIAAVTGCCVAK